jgi:flavin reductase (DIM6/NTAB) family NADH-FMN oxidoreductase RutF
MEKKQINENFFIPMPVVLVGTQVNGKANFMTVGWCSRANGNPPMFLCGIGNSHHTPKGIAETETFSVNIPSSALVEKTDYCGLVSGAAVDKSGVFDVFYGTLRTAPMIGSARSTSSAGSCRPSRSRPTRSSSARSWGHTRTSR